jgi:hypothetical protein
VSEARLSIFVNVFKDLCGMHSCGKLDIDHDLLFKYDYLFNGRLLDIAEAKAIDMTHILREKINNKDQLQINCSSVIQRNT